MRISSKASRGLHVPRIPYPVLAVRTVIKHCVRKLHNAGHGTSIFFLLLLSAQNAYATDFVTDGVLADEGEPMSCHIMIRLLSDPDYIKTIIRVKLTLISRDIWISVELEINNSET